MDRYKPKTNTCAYQARQFSVHDIKEVMSLQSPGHAVIVSAGRGYVMMILAE